MVLGNPQKVIDKFGILWFIRPMEYENSIPVVYVDL